MRRRAWVAWGALTLGIILGLLGRVLASQDTWNLLAGLCLLTAIALGLSLLPLWSRLVPGFVPMPDLFDAPRPGERWCVQCGHPTTARGPCRHCGDTPVSRGKSGAPLQTK